jgi:hypothetical protein
MGKEFDDKNTTFSLGNRALIDKIDLDTTFSNRFLGGLVI